MNRSQNHEAKSYGIWRFRNRSDIVTIAPPWLLGYRHTGRTFWIDKKKNIKTDPWLLSRFFDRLRFCSCIGSLEDHSMSNYVAVIDEHVKSRGLS
jgi:hypothetical protein